jgi:hypothetical protein
MRRIFWGFCRNWFLTSPLHYLSGRSDFGFEFAEIFVFEKRLPAITDTGSRRFSTSVIRGFADSRIVESRSRRRQLDASLIGGVGDSLHHDTESRLLNFLKRKLSASMIESSTPRTSDTESRRLRVSLSRGVTIRKKISLASILSTHRYGESFFKYKYLHEFEAKIGAARNVV